MSRWIARLKFSRKFLLIGVLACLMFLLPTVLLIQGSLARVGVAAHERLGLEPAQQMLTLLRLAQQHRAAAATSLGIGEAAAGAATERQARQQDIEALVAQLQASTARLGDSELDARLAGWYADWQALVAAVGNKSIQAAESNRRYAELVDRQLGLIEDVANSSGLARDADMRSHYLQKAVLGDLPQMAEALGQMRARGALLLARGESTREDRARIDSIADRVRQHYANARKALELAAGGHLPASVEDARKAALAAAEEGIRMAGEHIVRAEYLSLPPEEWSTRMTQVIDTQFALVDAVFAVLQESLDSQIATLQRNMLVLVAVLAALAAVSLWIMVMVTRSTTQAVDAAVRMAEAVAAGDLSLRVRAEGRDEIARLLQALAVMTDRLGQVVGTVRLNAESVASASVQIAQGNADLSARTEQQASSLEETAASMEELGSTVQQNADSAQQANQLARSAAEVATQGGTLVGQVVERMKDINQSSARIAEIIGVIDSIAFQTNILALNAAVEAARAGDQGRGFAVVASEVRALAQRSASAANEIKALITASVEQVEQGSALVDKAGATMGEIVASVRRVSDIVGEISAASAEQSSGWPRSAAPSARWMRPRSRTPRWSSRARPRPSA
ncbi:MAG: Methyl-accepting chemotaxis protein I [Paracidovorax wautersii]|uniref:Methyl-accepting chemotaxis protein I n=1 Tax=Paracidovorax wautersii TaxID=1177982 RepID=A0A7V8JPL3_9BURK|nr:MAG: Methyl-accepting chemotaxis protein I [Paracidovorax wautersii]